MKSCPVCQRLFPADAGFCPADGSALKSTTDVPVAGDADDPRVGTLVAQRYQVRRVVADGGMGRVYEALDTQDRTRVALKVLHNDVARDDVSLARFKREFEVSQLLPHDHIVDVRDFRQFDDGAHALVMEFLDGEELRSVLKREKRVHPARIVRMLSQVAIGLDEAHRRAFVHRDLKPDNLFLCGTTDGDVTKILDFGSVKDKSAQSKKLTIVGTTIGSPFYMSPEQAQGLDTLDARADVWSLAAIVYECLTGTVPFTGTNGPSILLSILTKDPAPPTTKAEAGAPLPPAVDDFMEVGLAKAVALRPPTVGALADAFGHAFGLAGSHVDWAKRPLSLLEADLESGRRSWVVGATPPPSPSMAPTEAAPARAHAARLDAAFAAEAAPSFDLADDIARGVPKGPPRWLLPVVVGALALLAGVGLALAMRH